LELEEVDLPDRTPPSGQRLVGAYSKALVSAAQRDAKLVALDADLVLDTGLIPFKEAFPERFLECGIAEQDMVSQAGALALAGWRPVVHSFACFLSSRPNEQIFNNATELSRVVYVGSLAGLLPGMPGHSHQCVRDISALAGVPGLELIEPACEAEVGPALDYCLNTAPGSTYLRLVSVPREIPYELPADHRLVRGRGTVLREGNDVVVIGYGPVLLPEAWRAAETLAGRGVSVKLVNLPWLNVVDDAWLRDTVRGARRVVALDNHFVTGGQGGMIAAALGRAGSGIPVRLIGVEEIPKCGTNDEVLRAHGLDAASLADRIAGV
jgi:transketolase